MEKAMANLEKQLLHLQKELETLRFEFEEEKKEALHKLRKRETKILKCEQEWMYHQLKGLATKPKEEANQKTFGTEGLEMKPKEEPAQKGLETKPPADKAQGLETKPQAKARPKMVANPQASSGLSFGPKPSHLPNSVPQDEYIKDGQCILCKCPYTAIHAVTMKHVENMIDFAQEYYAKLVEESQGIHHF